MRNIRLTIEYDGTACQGWAIQGDKPTIQKLLQDAIAKVVQHRVHAKGSGRTDTGVHALCQVANFTTTSTIPVQNLVYAINTHLPPDIAVLTAEEVDAAFHARFSAKRKTYRYRILNRDIRSPLLRNRVWHVRDPLDVAAMRQAARCLVGEHDFAAFQSKASEDRSSVRTIFSLEIEQVHDLIDLFATGNGFLYNMVRAIAGTLVQVGLGKLNAEDVQRILESKDRSLAGPTAPAQGLCLMEVRYT